MQEENWVLQKSVTDIYAGLENREYGHRVSAALTTWHPLSAKYWH
jgi:hypothetical protein